MLLKHGIPGSAVVNRHFAERREAEGSAENRSDAGRKKRRAAGNRGGNPTAWRSLKAGFAKSGPWQEGRNR